MTDLSILTFFYLGYGDHCIRIKRVEHMIGQHHVDERISVGVEAKVFVVVAGEAVSDAVAVVEHRRNAIKTISIHLVLFNEPA